MQKVGLGHATPVSANIWLKADRKLGRVTSKKVSRLSPLTLSLHWKVGVRKAGATKFSTSESDAPQAPDFLLIRLSCIQKHVLSIF